MPNTREIMELQRLAGMDKFSKRTVAEELEHQKLIELLNKVQDTGVIDIPAGFGSTYKWIKNEKIADHLIAHGVTVQKWIPVTEQLPATIPCGAGTEYSETVNVLTAGRKVLTAIWNGTEFITDAEFWEAYGEEITHWTPVLLPLPVRKKEGKDNV